MLYVLSHFYCIFFKFLDIINYKGVIIMTIEIYNKDILEKTYENIKEIKHTIDKFILISKQDEITVLNDDVKGIIKNL